MAAPLKQYDYETGRWYMNIIGQGGKTYRQYSDESQQQEYHSGEAVCAGYVDQAGYQRSYEPHRETYQEYPRDLGPRTHASSNSQQIPRSHSRRAPPSSSRGNRNRTQSFSNNPAGGRRDIVDTRDDRRDRRYYEDRGYNEPRGERSRGKRADYEAYQEPELPSGSSRHDPAGGSQSGAVYQDVSADSATDIVAEMDRMTMGDEEFPPSPNYQLSHSQPQQWTTNQYQSKGKAVETTDQEDHYQTFTDRRIKSTGGAAETLDPSFKKRNKDYKTFFQCGRVFKTLWTDPYDGPAERASEHSQFNSQVVFEVAHGQLVYSKIRRFVVVNQLDRSCQCLPVTTYNGRGPEKRGIRLGEHGLIYTGDREPKNISGITKVPLKLRPSKGGERLSDNSYINYGRTYSVDTNVKVKDLGELDSRSKKLLCDYYNEIHYVSYGEPSDSTIPPSLQAQDTHLAGVGTEFPDDPYYGTQSTHIDNELDEDQGSEQYWPQADESHMPSQEAYITAQPGPSSNPYDEYHSSEHQGDYEPEPALQPNTSSASYDEYHDEYHGEEHEGDYELDLAAGPGGDVSHFAAVDQSSQPATEPAALEEGEETEKEAVLPRHHNSGSSKEKQPRRRHRDKEKDRHRRR